MSFAAQLKTEGVLDDDAEATMIARVKQTIQQITALAVDPEASPPIDIRRDPLAVGRLMFKNETPVLAETDAGELVQPVETCSRVVQLAKRSRVGRAADGKRLSAMAAITIRDSLFEAILHHVRHDPSLIVYGEENREWGGAFGVYRGLSEIMPYHRLFNAPISEAATIASAVGYALEGGRALVELMYADFIGRAGDEIFNQMSKWQSMSGGVLRMPLVLRCSIGSKYGAQHSQDWTALVAHIPGLKVVYPATPYDAKGLMAAALSGHDPVVFFESQRLYDTTELFQPEGVPAGYYQIPLGVPDIKRAGTDVTILTVGPSLYKGARRGGRAGGRARYLRRDHRCALAGALRLRHRAGFGREDPSAAAGLGGLRARQHADDARRHDPALCFRVAGGAGAGLGRAELDRPRGRPRSLLFPAGRRRYRHPVQRIDPREGAPRDGQPALG